MDDRLDFNNNSGRDRGGSKARKGAQGGGSPGKEKKNGNSKWVKIRCRERGIEERKKSERTFG